MSFEEDVNISGGGEAFMVRTQNDGSVVSFTRGSTMAKALGDTAMVMGGFTVGKAQELYLHEKLQAWIDSNKETA